MAVIGVPASGFRGVDLGEIPALWIPAMMKRQATPDWDNLWTGAPGGCTSSGV